MSAGAEIANAFSRLTPRQATCLQLTAQLYSAKEIANTLRLEETTVAGYLADATRLIGARNKREAARLFAEHSQSFATPQLIGHEFSRLDLANPTATQPVSEERREVEREDMKIAPADGALHVQLPTNRFHLLRGERRNNDLDTGQRLAWILFVAVAAAVLFTASISIIDSLQRMIAGHSLQK
jgi:DNA-binding CsgD family transcriptional regulator